MDELLIETWLPGDYRKWDGRKFATAETIASAINTYPNNVQMWMNTRQLKRYKGKGKDSLFNLEDVIQILMNRYQKKEKSLT